MMFPKISLKAWLQKYPGLEVEKERCDTCGVWMTTTIPFLEKNWAGLLAPDCKCGHGVCVQVPRSKEAKYLLESLNEMDV